MPEVLIPSRHRSPPRTLEHHLHTASGHGAVFRVPCVRGLLIRVKWDYAITIFVLTHGSKGFEHNVVLASIGFRGFVWLRSRVDGGRTWGLFSLDF